jgi:hypothetical protein
MAAVPWVVSDALSFGGRRSSCPIVAEAGDGRKGLVERERSQRLDRAGRERCGLELVAAGGVEGDAAQLALVFEGDRQWASRPSSP